MNEKFQQEIPNIVDSILSDYETDRVIDRIEDVFNRLDKEVIIDIIDKMFKVIYPGYFREKAFHMYEIKRVISVLVEDIMYNLTRQISFVLHLNKDYQEFSYPKLQEKAEEISLEFFRRIPQLRAMIEKDVQATFDGDPAASSRDEIILSYPGLFAITVFRIAHELYSLHVPLIPRIMTEHAHSLTGIDINPGATIGSYFFIDHGTGIVIGETTTIGNNVKIYQGVTLGALSTRGGQRLRDKKRHPTIEDNVTIYSGASILGGDTVIGKDAVIGSNAFITSSVPEGAKVSIKNQELQIKYYGREVQKSSLDSPLI